MQGFQTAAHRLAQLPDNPQRLADGGSVAFGSRGLSGLRDLIPKMESMGFKQAQTSQPPAAAPAEASGAAGLRAMIPRMEAMGYRQAPQYLAKGGLVHGPGTGTSDSIATEAEPGTFIMPADSTKEFGPSALEQMSTVPVRLSRGEFAFAPEQVMGIGAAVLKLMKDATHEPVNGEDGGQTDADVGVMPTDRLAEMPQFADGGLVQSDITRVGNSYSGGNVGGDVSINGQAGGGTVSTTSWTAPVLSTSTPPTPTPAPAPAASAAAPAVNQATAAPPTPAAPAPMGWAERNAQRNNQVTASSMVDSPERRAAQAALAPAPAPVAATSPVPPVGGFQPAAQRMGTLPAIGQPRRYADGGVVQDDLQKRVAQIPAGGMQAPAADGSQNNPLNNEVGRNAMNAMAALPGIGGVASRSGAAAARTAGGAVSAERAIPAAWEVVQEGGALAGRAAPAAQQMGQLSGASGGALSRAASVSQGGANALAGPAGQLAQLPASSGQIAQRGASEVAQSVGGFASRARSAAPMADVVQPSALAAPEAAQAMGTAAQTAGRGFGRYAVGAAGLGGAALIAGSGGDSAAGQVSGMAPASAPGPSAPQVAAGGAQGGAAALMADISAAPRSGSPSPAALDAADILSSQRRVSSEGMALMPNAPKLEVQAPTVRHSGNDWAARKQLENLATAASSITNDRRWGGEGAKSADRMALAQAQATDAALQQAQPALDTAAMRETGANNRAVLQESGAASRAAAQNAGELQRTLITERGNNTRTGITAQGAIEAARLKAQQDGKALTEDQAKSAGYALRMDNALKLINEIGTKDKDAIRPGVVSGLTNMLPENAANMLRPEARQRVESAQLDALDAALTLNTGAAYTREQLQGLSRSYFAQPGDDDRTVSDKQDRLNSLIQTARLRAGPKGTAMADSAQATAPQPGKPAAGAAATGQPQRSVTRTGVIDGRRVVQYNDGSVEYAN